MRNMISLCATLLGRSARRLLLLAMGIVVGSTLCGATSSDSIPNTHHPARPKDACYQRDARTPNTQHQSPITNHQSPITHHPSPLARDYDFVKRSDPWLTSPGAAALTRYASANIAAAELAFERAKGGHIDYNDAPSTLQETASVEAFFRLSPTTVVYGAMSYAGHSGDDMTGSAFLPAVVPAEYATTLSQPHLPFDIVEDSLTNPGRKHRDVYRLSGAFGTDVWHGLALGARMDYTAANYAKYKDLRHKNKLMDMQLSAGIYWPASGWLSMGAAYLYHRNTESLDFSTYGKTDITYKSLVSYAAFMGYVEQFGDNGFTDKSREMPLVNDYNGVLAQLSFTVGPLLFYNAFAYMHRKGYYGRPSPYTITYTNHHSNNYTYDATLLLALPRSRHQLDLKLNAEKLENHANTFRELENTSGASHYEYYTPVKTADKLWVNGMLALTSDLSIAGELPTWTVKAGIEWLHRRQTAYVYPYYRRQTLDSRELFASLTRNLTCRRGVFSLGINGSFRYGDGQPSEDLTFAEPSD